MTSVVAARVNITRWLIYLLVTIKSTSSLMVCDGHGNNSRHFPPEAPQRQVAEPPPPPSLAVQVFVGRIVGFRGVLGVLTLPALVSLPASVLLAVGADEDAGDEVLAVLAHGQDVG